MIHDSLDPVVALANQLQTIPVGTALRDVLQDHMENGLRGHERIVELMGNAGHKLAEGPHFRCFHKVGLGVLELGLQCLLLRDVFEDAGGSNDLAVFVTEKEKGGQNGESLSGLFSLPSRNFRPFPTLSSSMTSLASCMPRT